MLHQAGSVAGAVLPAGFEVAAWAYLEELARWSRVRRLTGYRDPVAQARHLVIESLALLQAIREPAGPYLDIGTGSGAPGLILALARPAWAVVLLEAARRRANFLRHVLRRLERTDVQVEEGRAEALARRPPLRGVFRTVTLRAVATPAAAVALARPFLRPGGRVILPAGPGGRLAGAQARALDIRTEDFQIRRRVLIIEAAALGVSRETGTEEHGPHPGGGEPEGRRGEDDHGREPGGCPGAGGPPDAPGRP